MSEVVLNGHRENPEVSKVDRVGDAIIKVFGARERWLEFLTSAAMMGIEFSYDMRKVPNNYRMMGVRPDNVGPMPTDLETKQALDSMGDMLEVSMGHSILRVGFVALNEILKSKKVIGAQKKILSNENVRNAVSKVIPEEKVEELAQGAEIQISDDACFWTSLITTVSIKAIHSLGYISLFGIHDHMAQPVPRMLIGQAFAAAVLIASHYGSKNGELIKDKTRQFSNTIKSRLLSVGERMSEFGQNIGPRIQQGMVDYMKGIDATIDYVDMEARIALLMLEEWNKSQESRFNAIMNGQVDEES